MRDYALETTFDVKFTTRRFSTGAPFTLAGTPVISAYVGNSLTQITAGITLTVDFDGVTGLNNARVVATSAQGYAAGSNYALVIATGSVDSVSVVGEVVSEFSLEAQSPLRPTVAGRTLDVSAGGEGGLDWANVGSPTTVVGLSGTSVKTATDVETDTVEIGVAGAGLTNINLPNQTIDIVGNITGNLSGSVGSVTGAVGSVTAGVTLAATAVQAIWDALTSALTAAGSIGKKLADWVLGSDSKVILSNNAHTGAVIPTVTSITNAVKIDAAFKKNTAYNAYMFLMVDDTDGKTPETSLTGISCTRSIDGVTFGACANAATEVGSGWYKIDLAAGDLNGDEIVLRFTKAGVARNWEHKIRTNVT